MSFVATKFLQILFDEVAGDFLSILLLYFVIGRSLYADFVAPVVVDQKITDWHFQSVIVCVCTNDSCFLMQGLRLLHSRKAFSPSLTDITHRWIKWLQRFITPVCLLLFLLSQTICSAYALIMCASHRMLPAERSYRWSLQMDAQKWNIYLNVYN